MDQDRTSTSVGLRRRPPGRQQDLHVGDRVRIVRGKLAELIGTIVRCERSNAYLVGLPDADSAVIIRIQGKLLQRSAVCYS